jgi:hypothetical protein
MQTLEELKAKQAREVAKLEAEHALANLCPVPPKSVQLTSGGLAPWISYECESLVDALALVGRLGEIVPFWQYKGTFTRLQPEALATEKSGETVGGPFAFAFDVSQGDGFGPSAQLKAFYRLSSGEIAQAHIRLRPAGYGPEAWHSYSARPVYRSSGYGNRESRIIDTWHANNSLSAMSDKYIKWGTGDSKSAHFEYLFAADYEEGGQSHAESQLWSIAEESRRNTFKASPMVESFLGVLLQDAQHSESDEACTEGREARDVGTIWNCPESTFRYAATACRTFESALYGKERLQEAVGANASQAGSDLYLEMAGHGAGFRDRDLWSDDSDENREIGEALSAAADKCGRLESYLGDDGRLYICGAEAAK